MKLSIAIAVARLGVASRCVELLAQHAEHQRDIDLLLFGNGLTEADIRDHISAALDGWHRVVIRTSEANGGVPFALHHLWQMGAECAAADGVTAAEHAIAYLHDDLHVHGPWDAQVVDIFNAHQACGLAGFFGASGLGLDRLYDRPYVINNLVRLGSMSNMTNAEHHGVRASAPRRVAVLDGFSLIARQSLLDKIGGWAWWPFPHHCYDTALSCQCARAGMETWYVPVFCEHLNGFTANQEEGQSLLRSHGGDSDVHARSHVHLYEMFRDVLPLRA